MFACMSWEMFICQRLCRLQNCRMRERMFTLGMYGNGDFFDMKGVCEEFFEKIGMKKKMEYDPASKKAVPSSWKTGKHDL